jgi:hypothetical protein
VFVPAPDLLHLGEQGYGPLAPPSGEEPIGVCRTDQPHRRALPGREIERLEYSLIEGSCRSGEVKDAWTLCSSRRSKKRASLLA